MASWLKGAVDASMLRHSARKWRKPRRHAQVSAAVSVGSRLASSLVLLVMVSKQFSIAARQRCAGVVSCLVLFLVLRSDRPLLATGADI